MHFLINVLLLILDLPGLLSPRLRASMTDEPYIKRELESPTPKRQRLSVSNAQDMFDLMHQYSPPPPNSSPVSNNVNNSYRRRPHQNYSRWERNAPHPNSHPGAQRSPATGNRRSPYPPNHLRRSPHHGHGLRRSNRHRQHHQDHHRDSAATAEVITNFLNLPSLILDSRGRG